MSDIFIIIPAYNEENGIEQVLNHISKGISKEVIVVNNNSSDNTSKVAGRMGATVLDEKKAGYGRACLKGISHLDVRAKNEDIVVFLDADFSDHPEEMPKLLSPKQEVEADFVVGSRVLGKREPASMTVPQVFGNWLASKMIYLLYGYRITDLGPFRAIRYDVLKALEMKDQTFGWTVEMQVKALKKMYRYREVPVNYKKRIGFSKISGTFRGTIMAGYKIIHTILKYR